MAAAGSRNRRNHICIGGPGPSQALCYIQTSCALYKLHISSTHRPAEPGTDSMSLTNQLSRVQTPQVVQHAEQHRLTGAHSADHIIRRDGRVPELHLDVEYSKKVPVSIP